MPVILIGIAITFFFMFTNPIYNDIQTLNLSADSYNGVLDNSKVLENQRDALTAKYNAINPDNLDKLQKFLPENVDNVRLILEIGQIALPYGMVLKDVKYNVTESSSTATPSTTVVGGGATAAAVPKDYGVFDLEFSTSGTYDNFINFTKALESNLRLVDISSIIFSSDTGSVGSNPKTNSPEVYSYSFKIRTYYLKN